MKNVQTLEKGLIPIYEGENRRMVNARELHEFLESKQEFANWIKGRIEKYGFIGGEDYIEIFDNPVKNSSLISGRGRPTKDYLITIDMAKELCMVENNERGRQARKYFIAVEKAYREEQARTPQEFMDRILEDPDYAIHLIQTVKYERQQKKLLEYQRDEALRTKALIGNRREATAMATASNAVQRCGKLEDEIGNGKTWKQCTAMEWVKNFFVTSRGMWSVLGRKMAALSVDMGYEVRKIENSSYGTVNAYHVNVWEEFRSRVESNPEMMWKYRKA